MNIKRFISTALLGALLISTVQAPLSAAGSWGSFFRSFIPSYFTRYYLGVNQEAINDAGKQFPTFWNSGPDARLMAVAGLGVAAFFFFNWASSQPAANGQQPNLWKSLFGIFGVLGLGQWVNQKMNEGAQEYAVNLQEGSQHVDAVKNAVDAVANAGDAVFNAAKQFSNINQQPAANQPAAGAPAPAPQGNNQQQDNAQQQNNAQPANDSSWWNSAKSLLRGLFPAAQQPAPAAPAAPQGGNNPNPAAQAAGDAAQARANNQRR